MSHDSEKDHGETSSAAKTKAFVAARNSAHRAATLALLLIVLTLVDMFYVFDRFSAYAGYEFLFLPLAAVGACVAGGVGARRLSRLRVRFPHQPIGFVTTVFVGAGWVMAIFGACAAFLGTMAFARGRQVRSHGRVLLPPVRRGNQWTRSLTIDSSICANVDLSTRAAMAAQWRENGRTEHASVAVFAELTRDLLALGAPPSLLVSAQRDALDEIRHAEICLALAKALDGRDESPGAFPAARRRRVHSPIRAVALAALAVDSLVEGALHEGMSARVLARLAKDCADPSMRALLKEIAADEGRHAAHGWEVVRWCVAEGGDAVRRTLQGAGRALPKRSRSLQPAWAKGGAGDRYGIHGDVIHEEEYARTFADVQKRLARLACSGEPALRLAA